MNLLKGWDDGDEKIVHLKKLQFWDIKLFSKGAASWGACGVKKYFQKKLFLYSLSKIIVTSKHTHSHAMLEVFISVKQNLQKFYIYLYYFKIHCCLPKETKPTYTYLGNILTHSSHYNAFLHGTKVAWIAKCANVNFCLDILLPCIYMKKNLARPWNIVLFWRSYYLLIYYSHYLKLHIQAQHFINATQISYIPKPFDVNRPIPHPHSTATLHSVIKCEILSTIYLGMRNS